MITAHKKVAAGGSALIAAAGLTLVLLTGNAGATAPAHPSTAPAGAVVTKSVDVGAGTFTPDPNAPRPTATITASAAPAAQKAIQGRQSGVQTVTVTPGAKISVPAGQTPTSTVFAPTPTTPPGK